MGKIKELRKKSGLSLTEAARELGVSKSYLSMIESGQRSLNKNRAIQIAYVYGVQIEDVFSPVRFEIK